MQRLNRYYCPSRIAEAKFRLLVRHFALDLCAADAAQLTGISHRSVITIFGKIRRRVALDAVVHYSEVQSNATAAGETGQYRPR